MTPWLSLALQSARNWFWGWTFFLPTYALDLFGMVSAALTFYLMGQYVTPTAGFDVGPYIVTGVAFNLVFRQALMTYHQSLLTGYWANQVNTYMLYPGGVSAWLAGDLLARFFCYVVLQTTLYFAVGVALFGVRVDVPSLPAVLLVVLLALFAISGLGLIGASTFNLLNAKAWGANPVEWLIGFAATLVSGVYFPTSVLPAWLPALGEWLPQTHALRAGRLLLAGQAGLADPVVLGDALFLALFGLVAVPLGAWMFAVGMHRALREGTLTRWS